MTQQPLSTEISTEKQPMPFPKFVQELGKLAKAGKWKTYRAALNKREQWFRSKGLENSL